MVRHLQRFIAIIKAAGKNSYVDLPRIVVESLGGGAKIPVLVKIKRLRAARKKRTDMKKRRRFTKDAERLKAIARLAPGEWFRTTLVPSKSGGLRLYLDMWMRDAAGAGVRDQVHVTLRPDRTPRVLHIPDPLREALEENEKSRIAWEALSPSRRREILTYLNFLKSPAALERGVRKTIAGLLQEPWRVHR